MTIKEGIKNEGRPFKIPDCSRDDLAEFFKEMGYTKGVEVGVYKGEFTRVLAKTGLTIYGVDPWKAYEDYNEEHRDFQARQDELYRQAQENTKHLPNITLIRKSSVDASKDFANESLDFVYIDGHHGFKFVAEDIWEWEKKIKKGGVICGHDYALNDKGFRGPYALHTKYVVEAYTKAANIRNWFILGSDEKIKGQKRDAFRSWLWIKA